ncbi:Helix-turn-helix domain-containing protein [Marivirga sericea]|uniref:Helix-turn-helix domain-containing protein n=1 Tax=Marivirga sericea TaxID=1028 RepID=A0A1X7KVI0_9BACT|nr:helix-turn-helix transcriptional regulator [Marivirga sericea]SMG45253.1 Helix-turn-helix domain-containing protein [Marivirga sericea]
MKPIIHLQQISEINQFVQSKTKHPLVSVVDFGKVDQYLEEGMRINADFYTIMFKNYSANTLKYGRQSLDFQDGSLICIAPKQVLVMDTEIEENDDMLGWGLFFHPDLLRGTSLADKMDGYTFFDYDVTEALHLSDKEKKILFDCVQSIESELQENIDAHSQTLIVSNIELLLNYCDRYYSRQFITRKNTNLSTLSQVEKLLKSYFKNENIKENGLPTVKYLADEVHLSASYLSDLLKKETGMNAQDHIHYYLIEEAKNILLNTDYSASEIAYSLGFEYPQYFSKLFKNKTGKTPIEYRELN